MAFLIRFKSWLEHAPINEDRALLLSETINHSVEGKLLVAMLPLLDGTRSEDDIAEELSGQFELPEIYYQLIHLKQKGMTETVPSQEAPARDVFHARLGGDPASLATPQRISVTAIGGLDPQLVADRLLRMDSFQVGVAHWQSTTLDRDSLWIVLTPGYLEPELAEFNSKALEAGARWVPFKPYGIEPWIGPLVDPGETACVECLLHRLRGHRVREMQIAHEKGLPPRLSQGSTKASLDAACGLLGLELEKVISGSPHACINKGVVTINLQALETRCHELVRRPHCPACGDAVENTLTGLPEMDFTLTHQPKADYNDGGERIKAAAETMRLFEKRISPITGEVGELGVLDNVPEFFGRAVRSSWATLNRHKADASLGRLEPVGASAGKGRSETQARTSALGEALERYCSQHFGYEPRFRASYAGIKDKAVHPLELNQFSDSQYDNREEWAKRAATGRVPERFDDNAPVDWTPAWSLTHNRWKYVPSAYMYYDYPREGGGSFANGDSNGVAAGNCVEEAIIQGFMELVERDGVALWWYNMLQRPCLDLPTFGSAFAMEAVEGLKRHDHTLHVLDLTTDLGIPVFAAVGLHASDPDAEPLLGYGAHFDARIALDRAISEVGQSWDASSLLSPNTINRNVTGRNLSTEPFLRPHQDAPRTPLTAFTNLATNDFLSDVQQCVALLDNLGLEMLMADLTRPEVGLSVVRVMVPGLVHFWPRLGAKRLYEAPVKLGWLDAPKVEADLNPVPFYA